MKAPTLSPYLVVSDQPRLAAQVSCALSYPGFYLPVVDGPRLTRPDATAEIVRRNNAAARGGARAILLVGLAEESVSAFERKYPNYPFGRVPDQPTADKLRSGSMASTEPLRWGTNRIGIGLLKALRAGSSIIFDDSASPFCDVPTESGHLVICEQGEELSEVIAANYAFSLGAGMCLIPRVDERNSKALLEALYSLLDAEGSPTQRLDDVKLELRSLCGAIPTENCTSITFISAHLPFGFAFPEMPSTHLFTYPDLGISVVNGFAAEQTGARGVNVAVLIDPETTEAPEVNEAAEALAAQNTLVRVYRGPNADVTSVCDAMEHFPYDFLFFATHCGDASGYLWTYDFQDSENRQRTLVVEVTPGIGKSNNPDMFRVTEYMRIVSVDGVDWDDPVAKEKLDVGQAIPDWSDLVRNGKLKPSERVPITRVRGSAVLRMYDNNLVLLQQYLAHKGSPIIMANACASWHELAGRLMFQNARAYIGTLFPVLPMEAHPIAVDFLKTNYGKPLAEALWLAQNSVYGKSVRRPYVVSGVYPQVLRTTADKNLEYTHRLLSEGEQEWTRLLAQYKAANDEYGARRRRRRSATIKIGRAHV